MSILTSEASMATPDPRNQRPHAPNSATAAGLCVATSFYDVALGKPNPAAALDNLADGLDEAMTEIMATVSKAFKVTDAHMEFAETLRTSIADRLWAFAAIEHARAKCGDGYDYIFDFLTDGVRNGHDPHIARTTALDLPKRIPAAGVTA